MGDMNIGNVLSEVAVSQADKNGLVAPIRGTWRSWTFQELAQAADIFKRDLYKKGVRKGDRVMLMVRPSMEFICLTFSLFQLGAVVILIDPGMGYKNLLRCIGSVRPDILVGIPQAILLSKICKKPFSSVRSRIRVGGMKWWPGLTLIDPEHSTVAGEMESPPSFSASADDLAAIIFTTGSTGPPKGVQYTHGIFHTQLEYIRDYFGIVPGDIDQPGFPLFGLFSIALGATAVIPDMDPTRPAQVDPAKFSNSIIRYNVTYSFGSPAIWSVVSRWCLKEGVTIPVRKILMAGAPVSGELIGQLQKIMPSDGRIFTPYGATESLPIVAIEGREIVGETWAMTRQGKGTCVGRELPGITIRIIEPQETALTSWDQVVEMKKGEIGEIVVKGPVVTRAYDNNPEENKLSKIIDKDGFWHRIGDMGYLDDQGRLWFCGRKAHRVFSKSGPLYTICCEAIFNEHPQVFRSALVGVGERGQQRPVLIVELFEKVSDPETLYKELGVLAKANPLTAEIETFLVHSAFPVDIRHNAKIFREKLAVWAADQLVENAC